MKRRRIEITAFRRRTTVYSNEKHPTERHTSESEADRGPQAGSLLEVVDAIGPNPPPESRDFDESAGDESPDNNEGQLISAHVVNPQELALLVQAVIEIVFH